MCVSEYKGAVYILYMLFIFVVIWGTFEMRALCNAFGI